MSEAVAVEDRYAVFGNPVEHSFSPQIHAEFARQTGQNMRYEKKNIALDAFALEVKAFFMAGGKGLNVTVPFKLEAWERVDEVSERARLAGAVNTLFVGPQGELCGENTDGAGLVYDIVDRNKWRLKDIRILLVGAGGAARGVIHPLLQAQPRELIVANRTRTKAEDLVNIFSEFGSVRASSFAELQGQNFDLLINATSASLHSELPAIPQEILDSKIAVYDMLYGRGLTPFLQWAYDCGARKMSDGLGMLVGQAAESFKVWRGVLPAMAPVIDMLREN